LNLSLMRKMQNKRIEVPLAYTPEIPLPADEARASPLPGTTSSVAPSAAGAPAAGGVKKKKPKKKK
jgi:signal recognition particle subunit SRP9